MHRVLILLVVLLGVVAADTAVAARSNKNFFGDGEEKLSATQMTKINTDKLIEIQEKILEILEKSQAGDGDQVKEILEILKENQESTASLDKEIKKMNMLFLRFVKATTEQNKMLREHLGIDLKEKDKKEEDKTKEEDKVKGKTKGKSDEATKEQEVPENKVEEKQDQYPVKEKPSSPEKGRDKKNEKDE